jgi:cell division protein FtsN
MAQDGEDQEGLKKKLVRRIAIAGVVAAALLGGLALFEQFVSEAPAPVATAPTTAVAPAAPAAPPAAAPPAEEKKEAPPPEEKKEEKEAVRAEPEKTETPLAPAPAVEPRPASRVVIKPPAAAPAPAPKTDPALAIARSYRVQMGVFSSPSNAEELRAKLEQAGIPSYIESRVQVGPFKSQQEAEAARRKLKELGLGPGLLLPPQKK